MSDARREPVGLRPEHRVFPYLSPRHRVELQEVPQTYLSITHHLVGTWADLLSWSYAISPMPLAVTREAFDDPDWLFEPKWDGFRALAYIDGHRCQLVSHRGNVYKSWPYLCEELAHAIRCDDAVIDGEIVCLRSDGRSDFYSLMFRP